ncbi:MAG: PatB family C-S lyase, partial [bacterium]|nr:PatB family C-S lyase [bacterium]
MGIDFGKVINRRDTESTKHDRNHELFGRDDVLDMWVADMDFACPVEVIEAIKKRLEHPILGYSFSSQSLLATIVEKCKQDYQWSIKPEWIVFTAGVVNALYSAVEAFTHPGDEIIVQPPVYYPFYKAIKHRGGTVLLNPLKLTGDRYEMDYEGLEKLFQTRATFPPRTPRIKALILCSPHNPVGRVWSKDELHKLATICAKYKCMIFSDEIHCDLIMPGFKHTVTSIISREIEQNTITFMAASKTYNLAGLHTSFVVIPNDEWRNQYQNIRAGHSSGNTLGLVALEAAYKHGDDYVAQLNAYLHGNFEFFKQFIERHLSLLKVIPLEGTY